MQWIVSVLTRIGELFQGKEGAAHDLSPSNDQPSFNIDGSPMNGIVDVNGNQFGMTDDH